MKKQLIKNIDGRPTILELITALGSSINPGSRDRYCVKFAVTAVGDSLASELSEEVEALTPPLVITGITVVKGNPRKITFSATSNNTNGAEDDTYCGNYDFAIGSGELFG